MTVKYFFYYWAEDTEESRAEVSQERKQFSPKSPRPRWFRPQALEVLYGLNIIRFTVVYSNNVVIALLHNAMVISYLRHFRGF